MFFTQATIILFASSCLVFGAPVLEKRADVTDGECCQAYNLWFSLTYDPADILNYALTLEHLEDKFYREGLANFTKEQFASAGFDSSFYGNLQKVSSDETAHVNFLTTALKGMPSPRSVPRP